MDSLTISLLYIGTGDPAEKRYATPYDLFRDAPDLSALLAAAGESPALFPDGAASDLDKTEALCRLLPLMPGHPLRARITALLRQGFGWFGSDRDPDPTVLWQLLTDHTSPEHAERDLTLTKLARRMGASFPDPSRHTALLLPPTYRFCRPDPYHAAQYRAERSAGRPLSPEAQALLISQQVRETAELCLTTSRRLELIGTGAELEKLAAYLADQHRLPALICTLTDPGADRHPLTLPLGVKTALCLSASITQDELLHELTACAVRMPLLALDGLRLTVSSATDLGQIPILRETWQGLLKRERSSVYHDR